MAQINEEEWGAVRRLLSMDEMVKARFVSHEPYGIVLEIIKLSEHDINKLALVRVPDVSDLASLSPEYPSVHEIIDAVIIKFCDRDYRVWLSTKPSEFERANQRASPITTGKENNRDGEENNRETRSDSKYAFFVSYES